MTAKEAGAETVKGEQAKAIPPGFDPALYRWWDRWQCYQGETARGWDAHAHGLARGRHVIPEQAKQPSSQRKP